MGWSYSHVVLFGPDHHQVIRELDGHEAAVSPTVNGFTLIAVPEARDGAKMLSFGRSLSAKLACPAVIISEFDDDVLEYTLLEASEVADSYNSTPDYFDFAGTHIPPRGPQGGNTTKLCALLGRPELEAQLEAILRNPELVDAPERHRQMVAMLGCPSFSVGFDYEALQEGELPEGIEESEITYLGSI